MRKKIFAIVLLSMGLGLVLIPTWIGSVSMVASKFLVSPVRVKTSSFSKEPMRPRGTSGSAPVGYLSQPSTGSTMASLWIPTLGLDTSVVQGTTTKLLLLAPGHYPGSVLPGQAGASVIAGHNATFFRHINQLTTGAQIIITTTQGTFTFEVVRKAIVSDKAGLPNTLTPTLDLEACYPLHALYFTPDRYVVFARLIKSTTRHSSGSLLKTVRSRQASRYQPNIPASITRHFSLLLKNNSLPLGQLAYDAPTTPSVFTFQQSSLPLQVESAAIELWLAYKDASQTGNRWDLDSLGIPKGNVGNAYWLAKSIQFEAPLNITLVLNAQGQPISSHLANNLVRINGRAYTISMTISFRMHPQIQTVSMMPIHSK